ncbi:transposase [Aneurinibacillus aneurinilyticus]|uniref:Transposase n=1 Tax=Aneurinibacillus aneurinilyticus TaxID=1391 RepID=A0A848CT04_ANEAE|nr:transposase [Aneurinibacillus aneurinilyticus]
MIEGILRHCTDMEIDRNYVGTHGQSEASPLEGSINR